MKKSFFSKFDWAAFWVATLVSFAVYFYTLGPSVGLEDSGELATASAHLGVPHPPGYPFWTLCTWIFCKIFSFVTYMGHPNPAWAVSCCSAFFGALAAGCTAMLISRSAGDFVFNKKAGSLFEDADSRVANWFSFAGGVGGALAFAFSPVEWSQSTIVEIYSLNSLFLMLVFLLSYRWMLRPDDKTLWFTAFVFGLGLTNYQVLLFAIVPLGIMILLKNFKLFRDFALYFIPVALTYQVLKIGDMPQANQFMACDVINKHDALKSVTSCPSTAAVIIAVVLATAAIAVAVFRDRTKHARTAFFAFGGISLLVLLLAGTGVLAGDVSWEVKGLDPMTGADTVADITAPLVDPRIYLFTGFFVVASVLAAVYAVFTREGEAGEKRFRTFTAVSAGFALCAVVVAVAFVEQADAKGYSREVFDWASSGYHFYAVVAALFACSLFVKNGLAYSIPVAGFHIALFILLERGAINGLTHPTSWWFWWPVVWNFIVLSLAWLVLPNGRTVAFAALFTQLGVSFYAYMPIVSELRNPPMNWGYPRTWEGFKHAITRGQYEAITMPEFSSLSAFWTHIKGQMAHYFSEVKMQFSDYLALLALLPLACWRLTVNAQGRRFSVRALWFCAAIAAVLAVRAVCIACGIGDEGFMPAVDRLLILLLALPAVFGVLMIGFKQLLVRPAAAFHRYIVTAVREKRTCHLAACAVLVSALFLVAIRSWAKADGNPMLFLAAFTAVAVFASAVYSMPAILRWRRVRSTARVSVSFESANLSQHWLLASGACFFMMTLPLILLANVKGDIQDGFIQKVKFISSHAMIAMWIGYGLVFLAALLYLLSDRFRFGSFGHKAFVAVLASVMIFGPSVTPVVQNYTDDDIVTRFGGSEQNGHSFGWQFGAYQLDGAKAIRAQLTAEEEPLPDPDWPAPMEPFSIFFGGTDPGRFVPTYMIYGADFRPDVYLITQNALADDTYMSVQRDLYGDEIWIPSKEDSGEAFQIYLDEVKRGVRQANGDIREENGRVQVTGALGVMEINGILTKMMHDHDKKRHAFYIEESYAMPWMYPYLSPHGLIMKINAEKTPYSASTARKDHDFWDWYTRRLVNDPMYRRDFAAQKSFSKLRASIAGLYVRQSRYAEATRAFQEAHLLYPASPEATFRYTSEILLPMQSFDVIGELMAYTDKIDPNNVRTVRIKEYLGNVEVVKKIEAKFKGGTQTFDDAYRLADAYFALGRKSDSVKLMTQLVDYVLNSGDEERLSRAAAVFLSLGRLEQSGRLLDRYVAVSKNPDMRIILEWAVLAHYQDVARRQHALRYFDLAATRNPALAIQMTEQYQSGVPREKQDVGLWLRLARWRSASDPVDPQAMFALYTALTVDHDAVRMECERDPRLGRLMEELRKTISEQKRR